MVHKDLEITESIQHIPYIKENESNHTLSLTFNIKNIEVYDSNKKVSVIPFNELKNLFSTHKNVKMILQPIFSIHCQNDIHYFYMKLKINKIYNEQGQKN